MQERCGPPYKEGIPAAVEIIRLTGPGSQNEINIERFDPQIAHRTVFHSDLDIQIRFAFGAPRRGVILLFNKFVEWLADPSSERIWMSAARQGVEDQEKACLHQDKFWPRSFHRRQVSV